MARKGENIYKRKDGRWEGRYIKCKTGDGKAKYGYVYARSYRETKGKLACVSHSQKEKETQEKTEQNVIFETAAKEWLDNLRPKVKESTAVKYNNLLNSYILPELGAVRLDNITNERIEYQCNQLLVAGGRNGNGLSPKTVSDTLSLIRNILRYESDSRHLSLPNLRTITIRKSSGQIRVFTLNEQQTLCRYLYQNLNEKNIGILFCLFTGLRIGEICALKWEDVSLENKTAYIHRTMQRLQTDHHAQKRTSVMVSTPKSSCSIRTIPLSDELVRILSEFGGKRGGYILTGDENRYVEPRLMQNHFKRVLKENAIESANYHTLRHTFATRCIEIGFDVKSLSEILGHANVNITMNRYVHPSMELKRENMQRLSSVFTVS